MATLPTEFADLEPYADWCLEFERERYAKRRAVLGDAYVDSVMSEDDPAAAEFQDFITSTAWACPTRSSQTVMSAWPGRGEAGRRPARRRPPR